MPVKSIIYTSSRLPMKRGIQLCNSPSTSLARSLAVFRSAPLLPLGPPHWWDGFWFRVGDRATRGGTRACHTTTTTLKDKRIRLGFGRGRDEEWDQGLQLPRDGDERKNGRDPREKASIRGPRNRRKTKCTPRAGREVDENLEEEDERHENSEPQN